MDIISFPKPGKKKPKNKREPNLQKQQRLVDPAVVEAAKKSRSELSGDPTFGAAPDHWFLSVGAGGPDHPFNLIQLTAAEHIDRHAGNISKDVLVKIVADRHGVAVEYVKYEINRHRGTGRCYVPDVQN